MKLLIEKLFQDELKIKLDYTNQYNFYSGYCQQCEMNKGGRHTINIKLIPNIQIICCNKCYEELKSKIQEIIINLQKNTFYNILKQSNNSYNILNEKNEIEINWQIDYENYKFFIINNKSVYIPLKKENKILLFPYRHLLILNDIKINNF
jgi:hypothetical protein